MPTTAATSTTHPLKRRKAARPPSPMQLSDPAELGSPGWGPPPRGPLPVVPGKKSDSTQKKKEEEKNGVFLEIGYRTCRRCCRISRMAVMLSLYLIKGDICGEAVS